MDLIPGEDETEVVFGLSVRLVLPPRLALIGILVHITLYSQRRRSPD